MVEIFLMPLMIGIIVTAMMMMMWMGWCRARAGSTHANHKVAAGRITIAIAQKYLASDGDDTRYQMITFSSSKNTLPETMIPVLAMIEPRRHHQEMT